MIGFFYRSIIGFCGVAVVFVVYRLVVVPAIDKDVVQKKVEVVHQTSAGNQRYDRLITEIFPTDDWIRGRCKILDARDSILFFKDAKQLDDGSWQVKPFTMFLNPEKSLTESSSGPRRSGDQPVILRTLDGAIIRFEDDSSTNSPSGKFSSARMPGEVTVLREESVPGNHDDFEFRTRNIQVNRKQILAVNPVQFRYGPHHGSGHNLTIDLADSRKSEGGRASPLVKNLKTVELAHLDEIMIVPAESDGETATVRSGDDAETSLARSPTRITCAGPFRLDFGKSRVVLFDEVHLEQLHARSEHDHLFCDQLEVAFRLSDPKGKNQQEQGSGANSTGPLPEKLQIQTVMAYGSPARLEINSRQAYAQAERISYHLRRRIIHCQTNVVIRDGQHQFSAPEMQYKMTINNQLGTGWATGPGEIIGYPDDPDRVFKATWQTEFNIQPHEGKKVVSLHGNAQILFQDRTQFHSEELHLWIWEKRRRGPEPRWDFFPAQLLALRQVRLNAPELAGAVEEARIFWPRPISAIPPEDPALTRSRSKKQPERSGKTKARFASSGSASKQRNRQPRKPVRSQPVSNRFSAEGKIAIAYLTNRNELNSFRLLGSLPVSEPNAAPTQPIVANDKVRVQSFDVSRVPLGEQPRRVLNVLGSEIQVNSTRTEDAFRVTVLGKPSTIEADGVKFEATELTIDQEKNLAWSDVSGTITLAESIRTGQKPFGPEPRTVIRWNKHFEFDGTVFRLTDDVRFQGLSYLESGEQVTYEGRTKQLAAQTNQPVNFRKSPANAPGNSNAKKGPLGIQEFALLEKAEIKAVTRESIDQIQSVDELTAIEINVRTDTGDARAIGPGNIRSLRRGGAIDSSQIPGATGSSRQSDALSYLEIAFDGKISGNIRNRQATIDQNVRAVYGPAAHWNIRYDPDGTSIFGEEIYLNCDRMKVSQWSPRQRNRPVIEFSAEGNTELEGKKFRAMASRLTYTEQNQVVLLEGLNQTNARIWFRKNSKQPWQYGEAKKFRYQKSTSELVGSEHVQEMRFLQFEAPKRRRR